jgi:predicted ribosome quality control (RQC) complex YloA/Tae2 family protein
MKQKVTSEDIACLVPVLNNILDGAYLVQIYDAALDNTKTIIMKFRNKVDGQNKKYYLLIDSGIRIHTIDTFTSIRKLPSGCVGKFRKEIGDKRLYPIKQLGTDRSMDFLFSNEKHFIVELYDRGNLIITDKDYKIIYIARPYKLEAYNVEVNETYPVDIISNSGPELKRDISEAKGYIVENSNFSGFPIDSKNMEEFEDINLAMKKYFNTTFEKKNKKKSKKKERKNNRKFNIQGQIDKLSKNEDKAFTQAVNIESNVEQIQSMIDLVKNLIETKISFEDIQKQLSQEFTMFDDIKVDHKGLKLNNIELDYNISAYMNVSKIFSEKKKIQQKKHRASEIADNMKEDEKLEVKKEKLIVNRKIMKFENYWWFITNGFTILCGKSADDNESLLNNIDPKDILLHGHFDKSPWAVIKNPNKVEIPFKVINYAGQFLVQRSWNWTENYANDSYYTYPDKVSKSAPSGEYMGKGSRMVHEKNFLPNANLEMGIGVIFKCENEYISRLTKDTKIDFGMVMCAPYITMNEFDFKVKVRPSGKKSDKGRKKLLQSVIAKILKIKTKFNLAKDYIRAIPYEEWDKICIRTFTV